MKVSPISRIRDDSGYAMVVVMGAIALLTVVAVGSYFVASQALHDSSRVQGESRAFVLAQTGMDRTLSDFKSENVGEAGLVVTGSTTDGTYRVVVEPVSGIEYKLVSTGTAGGISESITLRFLYMSLWDMNLGGGQSSPLGGGAGFNGNAAVTGPLYVRGDMIWSSNANYEGGPLLIKDGALNVTGSGELGRVQPIRLYATKPIQGKIGNVYLAAPQSYSVPDIDIDWVDGTYLSARRDDAIAQSMDNVMGDSSSSINIETASAGRDPETYTTVVPGRPKAAGATDHYKLIQGNLYINNSTFGEWARAGSVYEGTGIHDDFAFDHASGTLYIEGTVYVDGNLTFGPNVQRYIGNGTIVATGDIELQASGRLEPAGGNVNNENALGLVTPGNVKIGGNQGSHYKGAIFCNGTMGMYGTGTTVTGSVIAGTLYGDLPNIKLTTISGLADYLPAGMPYQGGNLVLEGLWTRQ